VFAACDIEGHYLVDLARTNPYRKACAKEKAIGKNREEEHTERPHT
jgi:hypothetical protein